MHIQEWILQSGTGDIIGQPMSTPVSYSSRVFPCCVCGFTTLLDLGHLSYIIGCRECRNGGAVIQARLPGCPGESRVPCNYQPHPHYTVVPTGSPIEEDIGEHKRPG